jgi:hypothetical protein
MNDFKLPPRSAWYLRSSVSLRVVIRNYRDSLSDAPEHNDRRFKVYFVQRFRRLFLREFTQMLSCAIIYFHTLYIGITLMFMQVLTK